MMNLILFITYNTGEVNCSVQRTSIDKELCLRAKENQTNRGCVLISKWRPICWCFELNLLSTPALTFQPQFTLLNLKGQKRSTLTFFKLNFWYLGPNLAVYPAQVKSGTPKGKHRAFPFPQWDELSKYGSTYVYPLASHFPLGEINAKNKAPGSVFHVEIKVS